MLIGESGLTLDFPSGWSHFTASGRHVFQTSRREEVIVSGRRLAPEAKAGGRAVVLNRMIEVGLEAMKRAAASPELRTIQPISEESKEPALRIWTMFAETIARDTSFGQALFSHADGTLMLTYEAPFVVGADHTFRGLLGMIRKA